MPKYGEGDGETALGRFLTNIVARLDDVTVFTCRREYHHRSTRAAHLQRALPQDEVIVIEDFGRSFFPYSDLKIFGCTFYAL